MVKKSTITVSIGLSHGGKLWPPDEGSSHEWGSHGVSFGPGGARISTEVEVPDDTQHELVRILTAFEPNFVPHWQSLSVGVQPEVLKMGAQLREAAAEFDGQLRAVPSAIRLPPYSFATSGPNPGQQWALMWWKFEDAERRRFSEQLRALEPTHKAVHERGIRLPLPNAYEARHVNLTAEDAETIGEALRAGVQASQPSPVLWAIAWQNYEDRLFPAAIVVLGSAIETALKGYLGMKGDEIASYLLFEVQSPKLSKLLSCARKYADMEIPREFQKWLDDLTTARNRIVHKPVAHGANPLEVGRWFAVGEAILKRAGGHDSDPLVGSLVRISERIGDFPQGTLGIVMRRETDYEEETLHVLLDTGETRRFSENAFERLSDQKIVSSPS